MTKIAVISDIHANLPALTAVLHELETEHPDLIVHCGDAIAIGPFPAECMTLLHEQPNIHCVRGNHDNYFIAGLDRQVAAGMSTAELVHQQWTHARLSTADRDVIADWPFFFTRKFFGITLGFSHYGLTTELDDFLPINPEPTLLELEEMFAFLRADLIFYGHHHLQADHFGGRQRFLNPGSLGCQPLATAPYLLLTITSKSFLLEKREVTYDDAPLLAAFLERNVPQRNFIFRAFFGDRFN